MKLNMPQELSEGYRSRAQQARVITEAWAGSNLYCACCDSSSLTQLPRNEPAADLACRTCGSQYQLKSSRRPFVRRVVDSAYDTMVAAIRSDNAPNLFLLHYDSRWFVSSLTLIPSFCFPLSAIEKRKPLGPNARRAGWVGCNVLLDAIASDARIRIVHDSHITRPESVRHAYRRLQPLTALAPELRGWTLTVLNLARRLGKTQFSLRDLYGFESFLQSIYPDNKNIRPKIRQQLQVLRDAGFIEFLGSGHYRFVDREG